MDRRAFGIAAVAGLALGPRATAAARGLNAHRRPAAEPPPRFLVLMLHGFGSNGADMFGLAQPFQAYVAGAAFTAPDAPFGMGFGFSWVDPGTRNRGDERERAARNAAGGGPVLRAFVESELRRLGLGPERLILIGFSQGASVALNTGLRMATPPAAIVAYAGANLAPDGLSAGAPKPPVLLVRGADDRQMAAGSQDAAMALLKTLGVRAEAHVLPGLGHNIDDRGVRLGGAFIRTAAQAAR